MFQQQIQNLSGRALGDGGGGSAWQQSDSAYDRRQGSVVVPEAATGSARCGRQEIDQGWEAAAGRRLYFAAVGGSPN